MEIASTMALTPIQKKRLNQVRTHLGVMWVSEIGTIDGTQIQNNIIHHQLDEKAYKPILTRPYQPRPNAGASGKILDCTISQIMTDNNQTLIPEKQLGEWTLYHSTFGFWPVYISVDHTQIWLRTPDNG